MQSYKFACKYDFNRFAIGVTVNVAYIAAMLVFALKEYGEWSPALWKVGYFVLLGLLCYSTFEIGEYTEHYGLIEREKDGEIT